MDAPRFHPTAALAVMALAGCGHPGDPGLSDSQAGVLYLTDPTFRRQELEASLVDPSDGYAELRLASYGLAWEPLPVWNPRALPVTTADLGAASFTLPLGPEGRALPIDAAASAGDPAALLALGQEAFAAYPVQLVDADLALASP